MIRGLAKSTLLVAALLLAPLEASAPASAITINVNIGNGSNLNLGRGITCAQGARILRNRGYRNVVQRNCTGRNFVYRADVRRSRYEISVRASDGRVLDYRWLRRI